jgi:hypothetical protein
MEETLKFVSNADANKRVKELIDKGYAYRCLGCNKVYKVKRQEPYEDGHGGRFIDMCGSCGCDLFQPLQETTCLELKISPINGVLIFKEHHAKYCKCDVGEIWTGDAETECHTEFKLLEDGGDKKTYKCVKSGLKIIILKSTEEELHKPDELGSKFLRIPW